MKRFLPLLGAIAFVGVALISQAILQAQKNAAPDEAARAAAVDLFKGLSDEQKKEALLDYGDKDKYTEQFPAVNRKGIPYAKLSKEQKAKIDDVIRAMCSAYGAERCLEVAKQTGDGQRYLAFYGDPTAGKAFAWRVGMHHLTLVFAEFAETPAEFGPILLGGNPVKTLWDEEEKVALEFYAALTPDEIKAVKGTGNSASGNPIGKGGAVIKDLSPKARDLAKKLLSKRLDVFSADRRAALEGLIKADGGADELRIAVWGDMTKGQNDGGNYHWRIGGPSVIADWQFAGKGHIHMMVKGKKAA